MAVIKENMYDLQGVSIGEVALREYPDSQYFAPIIGYTGKISHDEYDALTEKQQEKIFLTGCSRLWLRLLQFHRVCFLQIR